MNWSLWTLLASHHEHFTSLLRARVYSNLLKGKCVKNIKKKNTKKKSKKDIHVTTSKKHFIGEISGYLCAFTCSFRYMCRNE